MAPVHSRHSSTAPEAGSGNLSSSSSRDPRESDPRDPGGNGGYWRLRWSTASVQTTVQRATEEEMTLRDRDLGSPVPSATVLQGAPHLASPAATLAPYHSTPLPSLDVTTLSKFTLYRRLVFQASLAKADFSDFLVLNLPLYSGPQTPVQADPASWSHGAIVAAVIGSLIGVGMAFGAMYACVKRWVVGEGQSSSGLHLTLAGLGGLGNRQDPPQGKEETTKPLNRNLLEDLTKARLEDLAEKEQEGLQDQAKGGDPVQQEATTSSQQTPEPQESKTPALNTEELEEDNVSFKSLEAE